MYKIGLCLQAHVYIHSTIQAAMTKINYVPARSSIYIVALYLPPVMPNKSKRCQSQTHLHLRVKVSIEEEKKIWKQSSFAIFTPVFVYFLISEVFCCTYLNKVSTAMYFV